jgi:RNA binding exosome subunit
MCQILFDDHSLKVYEFLLKVIGGAGGLTIFIIGLIRYTKDQIWKRNEFVAKEIKEFVSDKQVQNMMYMLDWGKRKIELFPYDPDYEKRFAIVTRSVLNAALQSHKIKHKFSKVDVAIRDSFDQFLGYFEMYERFIKRKLITSNEIEPYLKYWIQTISEDIEQPVRETIHHYINEYGYSGVQNLFIRFDKDIMPKSALPSYFNEEEEIIEIQGMAIEGDIDHLT